MDTETASVGSRLFPALSRSAKLQVAYTFLTIVTPLRSSVIQRQRSGGPPGGGHRDGNSTGAFEGLPRRCRTKLLFKQAKQQIN
jgi:hypothetical protein